LKKEKLNKRKRKDWTIMWARWVEDLLIQISFLEKRCMKLEELLKKNNIPIPK
jgi:hypothetical protein